MAAIKIKTKGKAIDIEPDCIADNAYEPPATNKTVATNPKTADHINASHKPSRNKLLSSNVNKPTTNIIPEIAMNWL